jgi:hypothetical protein
VNKPMTDATYRGSRKHILDWVESPGFLADLTEMLKPVKVVIPTPAVFMPRGRHAPEEVRLDAGDSPFEVVRGVREQLQNWWLVHHRGANTPNWDLAVAAQIEGRAGLVLVEAKANVPELKEEGKYSSDEHSKNSRENHGQIKAAIAEAREGFKKAGLDVQISIDTHYQLANRIAFMWKLATLGIPTVLVYLGFTGDDGIRDAGAPFEDGEHWRAAFGAHTKEIIPKAMLDGGRLNLGSAPAWLLVRSCKVLEQSVAK